MSDNAPTRAEFDELKAMFLRLAKHNYGILPAATSMRCDTCESRDSGRCARYDFPVDASDWCMLWTEDPGDGRRYWQTDKER